MGERRVVNEWVDWGRWVVRGGLDGRVGLHEAEWVGEWVGGREAGEMVDGWVGWMDGGGWLDG